MLVDDSRMVAKLATGFEKVTVQGIGLALVYGFGEDIERTTGATLS
jgi:hypothetical protein